MVKCIIKNLKKYFLLVSILFATILISSSLSFKSNPDNNDSFIQLSLPKTSISWNLSEYYSYSGPLIDADLIYPRVLIDDSDPNYNWSVWANAYPWITGNGTYSNPYVIERLHIDGQGQGGCLFIFHSTAYFIVRGCYFENTGLNEFDVAILTRYTENGQIYGNIFLNPLKAVYLSFTSHNNSVYRNYMKGFTHEHRTTRAIQIAVGSHNNTISQNIAHEFSEFSHFSRSNNNTIEGNLMNNTVHTNYHEPCMVFSECNNSKVIGNILAGAFANATFELDEEDCSGNVCEGNVVQSGENVVLPTPLSIGPSGLVIKQDKVSAFKLTRSHNNYIANNIILIEGSQGIPGFDLILVVGAVGVVSIVVLVLKRKNWKQS